MKRPLRTVLILVGGLVALGGILMVAWTGLSLLSRHDVRDSRDFTLSAGNLVIDTDEGGVTLEAGEPGVVRVERRVTDGINGPSPTWSLEGDRLKLRLHCPNGFAVACGGSYVVKVPIGVPLTVRTDDGGVTASGLRQDIDASTDNGGIDISDCTGNLTLSTDNGGVDVARTTADRITAKTDNGHIRVRLDNAPHEVRATTDNGGILVRVPRDDNAYAVQADTDNGGKSVQVPSDPRSPRVIVARTDNGGIDIDWTK